MEGKRIILRGSIDYLDKTIEVVELKLSICN
jgi:hypothetical protein